MSETAVRYRDVLSAVTSGGRLREEMATRMSNFSDYAA